MSLYLRHPAASPARIEIYPKRRRTLDVAAFAADPAMRGSASDRDVCYADFFVAAAVARIAS